MAKAEAVNPKATTQAEAVNPKATTQAQAQAAVPARVVPVLAPPLLSAYPTSLPLRLRLPHRHNRPPMSPTRLWPQEEQFGEWSWNPFIFTK